MSYQQTLDFLFENLPMYQRTGKAAYKANLDNTHYLDKVLGHPHNSFKTIHVAGTNGKGSVSHMLASVFHSCGYRTGLYTSPHLLDFRERIRVNGIPIPEKNVTDFVDKIHPAIFEIHPSFFEITVAMAFDYFREEKVDIAIIETGLGGRLDSTNIISPEVSVITNISIDHTEFLGNSLQEIAAEKGGIIKPGTPVVLGTEDGSVLPVFHSIAMARGSEVFRAMKSREFKFRTETLQNSVKIRYRNSVKNLDEEWESDLPGNYQNENLATTLQVIDIMREKGWNLPLDKLREGLVAVRKNSGIRGRWEVVGANPRIICDTAHNATAIREVMSQLAEVPARIYHIIWGMVSDKSPESILPLLPADAEYYFTQASIPRALNSTLLGEKAKSMGLTGAIFPDVASAIEAAKDNAASEDVIFIGGSTFVVADALQWFENS